MTAQREEPLLGLATTRELLEEIRARGQVSGNTQMVSISKVLLENLPGELLDYRTVDRS